MIATGVAAAALMIPGTALADWTVKVHVSTDEPVVLEHRASANAPWEVACDSPCDVALPVADEYRFAPTSDARETEPFLLKTDKPDANGAITVEHHKSNGTLFKASPFIIAGSAAVFITGIVMATVGITKAHGTQADGSREQTNAVTGAGTLLIMAGLGGGYFGVSSYINNKYSDANGDVRRLEPQPSHGEVAPSRGIAIFVPVFSGRF